jgi:hypothetical protein
VEFWQLLLIALFVLLPFTLMLDFHPDRERLDGRGRPLERAWPRSRRPAPTDDNHH